MKNPRTKHKFKKPSVLAFSRMINAATGFMYTNSSPSMDGANILQPETNTIRAIFNAATTKKDIDKEILKPQVFRNDTALLPAGHEWLAVKTNLIVSSGSISPIECNELEFSQMLQDFVTAYSKNGFNELSRPYLLNMITGRWLWRNLTVAQDLIMEVDGVRFNPELGSHGVSAIREDQRIEFDKVCVRFAKAMLSDKAVKFEFTAYVRIGEGQEIYPSQAFAEKQEGRGKILQTTLNNGVPQVIFSPQKISNAMRWIDIWYGEGADMRPLPIEAYGIDRKGVIAHRLQNKNSIYDLFDVLPSITEELQDGDVSPDAHFVMASLIRGGLYQQTASKG